MILKYKIPKEYKNMYDNKKTLYCEILQEVGIYNGFGLKAYKVKILNCSKQIDIMLNTELKKINLLDKIKLKLGGKLNECNRGNNDF